MKIALAAAGVVLALAPFGLASQYLVNIAMLTAFSAFLGQCWNIAGGFGGLTSFGHTAFFGIGAYAAAMLDTRTDFSPWLALPLAAALGCVAGIVIGIAAFRAGLRGSYFALVTLAVAEMFRIVATSTDWTRGGIGINVALKLGVANFQFADRRVTYGLMLTLLILATGAALWLRHSRFGARLVAGRENEDAARALGIDLVRIKTGALAMSGALTALGGVVYTQTYLYIDPNISFGTERSVEMLLVAMIGGAGSVWGPLFGAIALHLIADTSRAWIDTPGFAPMLYGVMLLAVVGLLPRGIASLQERFARA